MKKSSANFGRSASGWNVTGSNTGQNRTEYLDYFGGYRLLAFTPAGEVSVICHEGSYGFPYGLLEYWCQKEMAKPKGWQTASVICHEGSYGFPYGLLEYWCQKEMAKPKGWQTAEDVISCFRRILKGEQQ